MTTARKGTVIQSTGSWYYVLDDSGSTFHCRMAGKYRLVEKEATNPLAVGDRVTFFSEDGEEGQITNREERQNEIERRSHKSGRHSQVIAANINQIVIIASIKYPRTSTGFIDRLLISAEASKIDSLIVFNKKDLWKSNHLELFNRFKSMYEAVGYRIIATSAETGEDVERLDAELRDKTSLLCGHSGSGKSSLLNCISPGLNLKTKPISKATQKGKHTTTYATMHLLTSKTRVIDAPGIRDFGLMGIKKQELAHFLPEFMPFVNQCYYANCLHIDEPDCAVKKAFNDDKIAPERYKNYIRIIDNM